MALRGYNKMDFKDKLHSIMQQKGITSYRLERLSGLSQAALSRYLLGQRKPTFEAVVRIAKALNVSVDYFVSGLNYNELFDRYMVIDEEGVRINIPKVTDDGEVNPDYQKIIECLIGEETDVY